MNEAKQSPQPCAWPAGSHDSRAAGAERKAGSRLTTVAASRRPHHSDSGSSWSKASDSSAASTSSHRRFLRPAEIWLITVVPTAPPSVSNCITAASSVPTARASPSPPPAANAARWTARTRSGMAVSVRAARRVIRWPVTNSARSHQCDPMSANAREAPPSSASTRQLSSSALSSQSCR